MAAVRAVTMQRRTRTRTRAGGNPPAATTREANAKGRAKIVCEKRISRRKRASPLPENLSRPLEIGAVLIMSGSDLPAFVQQRSEMFPCATEDGKAVREKNSSEFELE